MSSAGARSAETGFVRSPTSASVAARPVTRACRTVTTNGRFEPASTSPIVVIAR